MPDKTHFDPLGWFTSVCLTLLFGAIALTIAVQLIRGVLPWMFGILAVAAAIVLTVRLAMWWSRSRQW